MRYGFCMHALLTRGHALQPLPCTLERTASKDETPQKGSNRRTTETKFPVLAPAPVSPPMHPRY